MHDQSVLYNVCFANIIVTCPDRIYTAFWDARADTKKDNKCNDNQGIKVSRDLHRD